MLFITHDIEESIFLSDRIYVMTARPGRIKAEIKVPLPRPRTSEMTATPEFIGLVQELKRLADSAALPRTCVFKHHSTHIGLARPVVS